MRTTSLLFGLPILLAAAGAAQAAEQARQSVSIRFALVAGGSRVECGKDIPGLGVNKINAKLRDARFYVSTPALIDKNGKEVPIALDRNEWQNAYVALLDFENNTGHCRGGNAATNDSIKGTVPVGRYKGLTFTVGVPTLVKGPDGKDIVLNHSNFATAEAPLDIQSMAWNWQGGRKFIKFEIEPEGGVTRQPLPVRAANEGGASEGGKAEGAKADAGKTDAAKPEVAKLKDPVQVNADGTVTMVAWMLHFGSTGCKGDPLTGAIISCATGNHAPVRLSSFDPAKNYVVFDVQTMLAGIDLNHDKGGATGCMSGLADPECQQIYESLGLNFNETAPDANDQGKPSGVGAKVFSVGSNVLADAKK